MAGCAFLTSCVLGDAEQLQNSRKRVKRSGQSGLVSGDMQTSRCGARPDDQGIHGQKGERHRLAVVTNRMCIVYNGRPDFLLGMVIWLGIVIVMARVPIPLGCHATVVHLHHLNSAWHVVGHVRGSDFGQNLAAALAFGGSTSSSRASVASTVVAGEQHYFSYVVAGHP